MQLLSQIWHRWQGWLKILSTIILLGYLLKITPISDMWQQLSQLSPISLGISFSILLLSNFLFAYAWAITLNILRLTLPIGTVGKLYFQSLFINNFASFIGGDSLRAYQISRSTNKAFEATISVLLSRTMMLYSILLLAGFMTWGWGETIGWEPPIHQLSGGFSLLLLLIMPILTFLNRKSFITSIMPKVITQTLWGSKFIKKIDQVSINVQGNEGLLLFVVLITLLAQLLSTWAVWWLASAMNIPITWWQLLLFLSIVGIALILPISFNGIGLRELGLVGLLTSIGVDNSEALALSLSTSLLIIVVSFVGGISLLVDFTRLQFQKRNQKIPQPNPGNVNREP
jgi:uncharacterized membrane protein YbhN (UPF0104 family)